MVFGRVAAVRWAAMRANGKSKGRKLVGLVLRGFAIGTADLVPGVSGGTVALVTGIYGRLVAAIGSGALCLGRLLRGDTRGSARSFRRVEWPFLISIGVGAGLAVALLAGVVENLLQDQPVRTAAVFFGLIAGAIVLARRLLREPVALHTIVAGAVGAVAFVLFGFRGMAVHDPDWYVFLAAGALGICAFILPGVSGSFLLLAIGMYQHVLGAINERHGTLLLAFALGAAVGLGLFSRLLHWLLDHYHDLVVAAMIGLMIGSFRILWPWPAGVGDENGVGATALGKPGPDLVVPVVLAIASAVFVVGFTACTSRAEVDSG